MNTQETTGKSVILLLSLCTLILWILLAKAIPLTESFSHTLPNLVSSQKTQKNICHSGYNLSFPHSQITLTLCSPSTQQKLPISPVLKSCAYF